MIIYHITFYTIIPPILSYPDIYSSEVVQTRFIFSSKYSYIMSKMIGIRHRYVAVFKKFTQNNRQHCSTKFGKKPKIATFRCFKNHVKIEFQTSRDLKFFRPLTKSTANKIQVSGVSEIMFSGIPVLRQIVVISQCWLLYILYYYYTV